MFFSQIVVQKAVVVPFHGPIALAGRLGAAPACGSAESTPVLRSVETLDSSARDPNFSRET
jgi:hypothetical protein